MASKSYGIHDKWTDINKINNVDIKSVDGVIESVKINGEEAGGGGSSDFSTAKATVNNQAFAFYMPVVDPNTISVVKPASGTFDVPLYKGRLDIFLERGVTANIESGNATLEGNYLVITGDCTITIS